jgi:hypothetical protein
MRTDGYLCALFAAIMFFAAPVLAQEKSADELAAELANPGGSNATLNFKFEYRTYGGNVPGAGSQSSLTNIFQPTLPFKLNNGDTLIVRPSFSFAVDQPRFDSTAGSFSSVSAFGDIPYDVLYSTQKGSWTLGAGVVGSIPTGGTYSSDNWTLGPSILAVNTTKWGVWGLFPFHNEKIGGNGASVSITSLQYFLFFGLGNGWQIGTGPTMSYDWNATSGNEWTVPLGTQLSKTTSIGNLPIKFSLGAEYNVVRPDNFGSDLKLSFIISPVIKNPFQR